MRAGLNVNLVSHFYSEIVEIRSDHLNDKLLCLDPDLDAYCFISPDPIINKIKLRYTDPDLNAYCFNSFDLIIYKIKL